MSTRLWAFPGSQSATDGGDASNASAMLPARFEPCPCLMDKKRKRNESEFLKEYVTLKTQQRGAVWNSADVTLFGMSPKCSGALFGPLGALACGPLTFLLRDLCSIFGVSTEADVEDARLGLCGGHLASTNRQQNQVQVASRAGGTGRFPVSLPRGAQGWLPAEALFPGWQQRALEPTTRPRTAAASHPLSASGRRSKVRNTSIFFLKSFFLPTFLFV